METVTKGFFITLLFLAAYNCVKAQGPRFVYSDSFYTANLHPMLPQLIKANGIKNAALYRSKEKNKSMLFRTFQYNDAGYLVRNTIHSITGAAGTEDIHTYNEKHQLTGFTMQRVSDKFAHMKSTYTHYGDTLTEAMHLNFAPSGNDTGYETKRYNPHITHYTSTMRQSSGNKTYNYIIDYFYDAQGNPAKRVTNYNNGEKIITEYYEYKWAKGKKTLTVSTDSFGQMRKISVSRYNKQGQCVQVVGHFPDGTTYTTNYTYHPNGLINTYTETTNKGEKITYKFLYNEVR